jgi:hypothetical protein
MTPRYGLPRQLLIHLVVLVLGLTVESHALASVYYRYDSAPLQSSTSLQNSRFSLEFGTATELPSNLDFNAVGLTEPASSVPIEEWWFSVGSSFAEGNDISLPGLMFLLFRTDASGSIIDWFFYVGTSSSASQPSIAACSNSDGTVCGGIPDYVQLVGSTPGGSYGWGQTNTSGAWLVGETSTRPSISVSEPSSVVIALLGLFLCAWVRGSGRMISATALRPRCL